jgi:DNA-directed RNA polymerase subunit RPC12/RpoP
MSDESQAPIFAGQKPGAGDYVCSRCGHAARLTYDDEVLPSCRDCGYTVFLKAAGWGAAQITDLADQPGVPAV